MKDLDLATYLPLHIAILADTMRATGQTAYGSVMRTSGISRMVLVLHLHPDTTQVELCRITGADKALVSRTLKVLQKEGLVVTEPVGKRHKYRLSQAGLALHAKLLPIAQKRQRVLVEGFTNTEIASLVEMIQRLQRNLDEAVW